MKNRILLFCAMFIVLNIAQTEKEYTLENIIVTAGKSPVSFKNLGRSVEVISAKEIKLSPAKSINELLKNIASVDVRMRGSEDVQSDISIRGGSFEQTLILIDGIKVNDPQTGHHNLNIPVSLENVERIEILKGQGSRIHGPNALSGVVNIITKKHTETKMSLNLTGAQNGTYGTLVNISLPVGKLNQNFSAEYKISNGYKHNTGYEIFNLGYNASVNFEKSVLRLFTGYNDKDFGANYFYFPGADQTEKTNTLFANLSYDISFENINIITKAYWRKNKDDYFATYKFPSAYENIHETNVYGADISVSINSNLGSTSFGAETYYDEIESNGIRGGKDTVALGSHNTTNYGFFAEQQIKFSDRFTVSIGGFAHKYRDLDWKFWPGIDFAFNATENIKLFGSAGKAFRLPTYTELYYWSSTDLGNKNLVHEESTNYELGISFANKSITASSSYFRREADNLIDWVFDTADSLWRSQNLQESTINGFETNIKINPLELFSCTFIKQISFGYTYIDSDLKDSEFDSRYTLDNLKNQANFNVTNELAVGIIQNWNIRYEERIGMESNLLIDTQLSRSFRNFDAFVTVTNLFNESNFDFNGVELRGRWIKAGIKINLL